MDARSPRPHAFVALALGLALLLSSATALHAQGRDRSGAEGHTAPVTTGRPAKIQWFGTWEQGLTEARRTGRPILLTSAAPQCQGISGFW